MPQLRLLLLGSPQIELDGKPVRLDRRKAVALLVYLAVNRQPHSRDTLATLLWPESDQSRGRAALRRTLSVLNQALAGDWLDINRETVTLAQNPKVWVDVEQFQQLVAKAQQSDTPLPILTEAEALYRDDFLAGFTLRDSPTFDEWQFFQAETLRQTLSQTLEQLVQDCMSNNTYPQAITYARRWVSLDPLHEPAHQILMQLYAYTDQRVAALRQFQECERILEEELGAAPSEETAALNERIRAGELKTDHPNTNGKAQTQQISTSPITAKNLTIPSLSEFVTSLSPANVASPFVARSKELQQLKRHLETALDGQGQVTCVTGEAGSGKTALVKAFIRQAEIDSPNLITLIGSGNALTGQGDPYLPFREMLGLLTGNVEVKRGQHTVSPENARRLWQLLPLTLQTIIENGPDLINTLIPVSALQNYASTPHQSDSINKLVIQPRAKNELCEQWTTVLHILSQHQPLLLIIDDAQWADTASINLLFHLSRRLSGSKIMLVVTYRADEIIAGRNSERHPLEPVINEMKRSYGDIQIDLSQAVTQEFVDALVDTQPNQLSPQFRASLYHQTDGHPLFTVELLSSMRERGAIIQDNSGNWVESSTLNWDGLPARIEAVIEERISRLDHNLRDLLTVASVQGEIFTAEVIAQVQQVNQRQVFRQVAQATDKGQQLIRECCETEVDGRFLTDYSFRHTLFQQYLYNSLSTGERRLLHGDIARVLEQFYQGHIDEITVQLAHHFSQAGETEKAISYLLKAGDKARNVHANKEAIDFYQQALILLKQQGRYDRAARTLMKLGLTYHLNFNFNQSRQAYNEGFALWQQASMQPTARPAPAPHPFRVESHPPATLDPTLSIDDNSGKIINQIFCGLVALNTELDVIPEIATNWEVKAEGRQYLFHLRDDVFWNDGVKLTAYDFEYAWKRLLDPTLQSPVAIYLYDIKGAKAFGQGDTNVEQVGVKAIDDKTLSVELEWPTSYFPQLLTSWVAFPVPRHVVEEFGNNWAIKENIVTYGPFNLKEWVPEKQIVLERNPAYKGHFTGNVERVEVTLGINIVTEREPLYQANKLDVFSISWAPTAEDVRQKYAAEYFSKPLLNTQYIGFNTRVPPFNDPRVRQAFVMAVDRDTLAHVRMKGFTFPANGGFVPPGMPGHSPEIGLPYNPRLARQLLAETGYTANRKLVFLGGISKESHHGEIDYLSEQWRENLGVDVTWEDINWNNLFDRLKENPPHLFRMGWTADYPDPDNFLRLGTHADDWTGWHNPTFFKLLEKARRIPNQVERLKLYQQADKILIEEASIMPLLYGRGHILLKPWVAKYPISATNWFMWKDVVIDPH